MFFGFIVGVAVGFLTPRLWKPLMSFYLHKEEEIKKVLEQK